MLGTFNSGCQARDPDPQPCAGRRGGDDVTGKYRCRSDGRGAVERPGRAEDLLPDGSAQLRPRRQHRRLPGPLHGTDLLKRIKKRSVYILHDNQTFGKGVANAFRSRANKLDIDVKGFEAVGREGGELRGDRPAHQGHRRSVRGDLGGIVCNNGVKLIKDLGVVLGGRDAL